MKRPWDTLNDAIGFGERVTRELGSMEADLALSHLDGQIRKLIGSGFIPPDLFCGMLIGVIQGISYVAKCRLSEQSVPPKTFGPDTEQHKGL